MRYTAFWLTLAACCAFSAGSALAQGAGQGHHEVGSGVGNPSVGAGAGAGVNHAGQGTFGPNGSSGADISSGPISGQAGQGHFEAGGSGGGANVGTVNPGGPIIGAVPGQQYNAAPNGNQNANMNRGEDWRIVYNDGVWWYYHPDKSWSYFQNGTWQAYHEPRMASRNTDHQGEVMPNNQPENKTPANNKLQNNKANHSNTTNPNNVHPNNAQPTNAHPNNANSNNTNSSNANKPNTTKPNENPNARKL